MSLSSRLLRLSIPVFVSILPSASIAQVNPQFLQPVVQSTGGRVTSFIPGNYQVIQPSESPDILYVNGFTTNGTTYSVTAGVLIGNKNHAFTNLPGNQVVFPNVFGATPAVADFDGDRQPDFAFVLAPVTIGGTNLCVYHGTGGTGPPVGAFGAVGCSTFPTPPNTRPVFGYVLAAPFKTQGTQQLFAEDTANNYIYVLSNNGNLSFTETAQIAIPAADGSGPIYTGDVNGDGNTDILINNQTSHKVTLYLGNGNGTFQPPTTVAVNGNVYSMLLQDMNGDGISDLVTEVGNGRIEIQLGNGSNIPAPFGVGSVGGTTASPSGFSGNGGHLAAIADVNHDGILDILTTTPIGLSVLLGEGGYQYQLKGIYNAGPGHSIFAVADFDGDGNLDFYLDSPEGIAVVLGNHDGSFQTSLAYPAGQPALNATIADVNVDNKPDVVVATGAIQAQILTGNGDGTFNAPTNTNTLPNPSSIPANLWSTVLTGDFDGDGCPDLLYSLTGLPVPTPGSNAGSGLYLQYGNKPLGKCDGTFQSPQPISNQSAGAPADNNFYGESAVADLNGDGLPDIANIDTYYYDTLLSQKAGGGLQVSTSIREDANSATENNELDSFSQAAAGFFTTGRNKMQDLVFQDDANITPYVNKQDGSGTFTAMPALSNPPGVGNYYGGTIIVADIDGDGHGDIIIPYHNLVANPAIPSLNAPNQLYIWYGNGDGTFQAPQIIPLSRNYYLAQVVDMNSDGLPDIVLSDGYLVSILYNQGNHTFTESQHFLAGQGINSISVADVDNDGSLDLIVANGGATISNAIALGGKSQGVTALSLTPNADVNTGGITVLLNGIKTRPVTGTLAASPEPSTYQATFKIVATLTPTAGVALPTGTVIFSINGTQVGTVAVVPGTTSSTATYVVPAGNTYQGTLTLTASYSGDPVNSPIPLISGTHAVQGSGTTTTLVLCISGSSPSCPVTGVPSSNLPYVPSFTITFGQGFNGTTSVMSNDGSLLDPGGSIAFNDDYNGVSSTLCTLILTSGVASECPPAVGVTIGTQGGTHVFTAIYSGDATHTPSTSPSVTINILPDTNIATLIGAPNPQTQGQPVTFTATFTGNFAAPTGTVTFSELFPPTAAGQLLGTVTLVPGSGLTSTATFITSSLPVGTDTIAVSYAATLDFATALATTIETITPAGPPPSSKDFSITVTPSPVTVGVGNAASVTVTVTPVSGFQQGVSLSCSNLPYESACAFTNFLIPPGGGSTTLLISTMAPHNCGSTQPYFTGRNTHTDLAPLAVPMLAGLAVIFIPGRRRWLRALIATVAIAGAMQITGCGTCTDLGTRPNTYTIQVVGAATGTTEVESQAVTLNVTI